MSRMPRPRVSSSACGSAARHRSDVPSADQRLSAQLQIENHGVAPQHWAAQPQPDPVPAHGQALDVEAVLFCRDLQKRSEVWVRGQPALKGTLLLAELEPAACPLTV